MAHLNGKMEESLMKGLYKVVGRELRKTNTGWPNTPELVTEGHHSQPSICSLKGKEGSQNLEREVVVQERLPGRSWVLQQRNVATTIS